MYYDHVYSSRELSNREKPAASNFDLSLEGLSLDDVKTSTAVVASKLAFRGTKTKPLVPPIYHSSTYILDDVEDLLESIKDGGSSYSRLSNETTESLEAAINVLERGAGSLSFSSGMAAISSIQLGFLKKGDHVIHQLPCYPGTLTHLRLLQSSYGIEISPVKEPTPKQIEKLIKPNTKMIWLETPCNPEIVVVDIQKVVEFARQKGDILVAVDGTFASPYLQKAMSYGVDFSVHSCTKYMGGHSDLIAGCVTTRTVEQWRKLKHIQGTCGNMLSPHDASLLLRGLKTLPLRMLKHSENALKLATYLEKHPKIARVNYPGLKSHPEHAIALEQMPAGFGGMIMADVKGGCEGGKTVAKSLKIFNLAVSLGGVESIIEHAYSMTHGPYLLSEEDRLESGIGEGMLRISVGLEDADDLIKDFEQALSKVQLSTGD